MFFCFFVFFRLSRHCRLAFSSENLQCFAVSSLNIQIFQMSKLGKNKDSCRNCLFSHFQTFSWTASTLLSRNVSQTALSARRSSMSNTFAASETQPWTSLASSMGTSLFIFKPNEEFCENTNSNKKTLKNLFCKQKLEGGRYCSVYNTIKILQYHVTTYCNRICKTNCV